MLDNLNKSIIARRFASGDHLTVSSALVTAAPMTLACWFLPAAAATQYGLMSIFTSGSTDNRFTLNTTTGSAIAFNSRVAGNAQSITTDTFKADCWSHAAGVTASTTSRFAYLNGVAATENTTSASPSGVDTTTIGRFAASSNPFVGRIAWPAIWNVALTHRQIALLASGVHPTMIQRANLLACWDFEGRDTEYGMLNPTYNLTNTGSVPVTGPSFLHRDLPRAWTLAELPITTNRFWHDANSRRKPFPIPY